MAKFPFNVGEEYMTRGREKRIVCANIQPHKETGREPKFPIITYDDEGFQYTYARDGRYADGEEPCEEDIIGFWKEPTKVAVDVIIGHPLGSPDSLMRGLKVIGAFDPLSIGDTFTTDGHEYVVTGRKGFVISDRDWPIGEGASKDAKDAEKVDGAEPPQENTSSEPLYYLQNVSAGYVGNSPQFWRQGDSGYTAWISTARKFTAKEIEEIIRSTRGSHEFAAWNAETIDMIADKVVDMQELRGYKPSFTTRSVLLDRQTEQIIDANGPTN